MMVFATRNRWQVGLIGMQAEAMDMRLGMTGSCQDNLYIGARELERCITVCSLLLYEDWNMGEEVERKKAIKRYCF